jgi:Membrane protease subunits, stomatin/prohibitin homologs
MRHHVTPCILIGVFLLTAACGSTVQPGQRGLRWHPLTEGLSSQPLKNGFYWRAPWNDVYVYDVRWQSYTETVDALSADDLQVNIKAVVILRPIAEEIHFLAQEVGSDFYARIVRPEFMAAVRSVVSGYPMVTVPEKSVEIANKVQGVVVGETQRPPSGYSEHRAGRCRFSANRLGGDRTEAGQRTTKGTKRIRIDHCRKGCRNRTPPRSRRRRCHSHPIRRGGTRNADTGRGTSQSPGEDHEDLDPGIPSLQALR